MRRYLETEETGIACAIVVEEKKMTIQSVGVKARRCGGVGRLWGVEPVVLGSRNRRRRRDQ